MVNRITKPPIFLINRVPRLSTPIRHLSIIAGLAFLSACETVIPENLTLDSEFRIARNWSSFSSSEAELIDNNWLASFGSRTLEQLVDEALENNRDLRTAAARVDEAAAQARQAGADLQPQVVATGDVSVADRVSGSTGSSRSYSPAISASWELDIWNNIRNRQTAAELDALAQETLYESARLSIAADVVDAWLIANTNRELLNISEQEVSTRRRTLLNIEARVAERSALVVDANRARANLAVARARQSEVERQLEVSVRNIETLLGRFPDGKSEVYEPLPRLTGHTSAGLPSELLERRPDVLAAEQVVVAAFHRRLEANSARFPRFTLSASITGDADTFGQAFDPDNIIWGLVGGVIAPIFNGGELNEQLNITTAQQEIALQQYAQTVLTAFSEIENALANEAFFLEQLEQQKIAADQYSATLRAEQERFEAGEVDLFQLSDTQLNLFTSRRDIIRARSSYLRNRVSLHLALGGSFRSASNTAPAGPEG